MIAAPGHTVGVSVEIPQPHGAELDALRARYQPDADGMPAHVTVIPPVDVDSDMLDPVIEHLAAVAAQTDPFRLVLRGAGTFRPVSPVVFVAVADGISSCEALERRVRTGVLAVETRYPYHPHVTVAHEGAPALLDEAFDELAGYRAVVTIASMSLHERHDGRWELIRAFGFGR